MATTDVLTEFQVSGYEPDLKGKGLLDRWSLAMRVPVPGARGVNLGADEVTSTEPKASQGLRCMITGDQGHSPARTVP